MPRTLGPREQAFRPKPPPRRGCEYGSSPGDADSPGDPPLGHGEGLVGVSMDSLCRPHTAPDGVGSMALWFWAAFVGRLDAVDAAARPASTSPRRVSAGLPTPDRGAGRSFRRHRDDAGRQRLRIAATAAAAPSVQPPASGPITTAIGWFASVPVVLPGDRAELKGFVFASGSSASPACWQGS